MLATEKEAVCQRKSSSSVLHRITWYEAEDYAAVLSVREDLHLRAGQTLATSSDGSFTQRFPETAALPAFKSYRKMLDSVEMDAVDA